MERLSVYFSLIIILRSIFVCCDSQVVKLDGLFQENPDPFADVQGRTDYDVVVDATFDDESFLFGSGSADPRSFHHDVDPRLRVFREANQCIINVERAEMVFIVDVGIHLPAVAVPNVKDFIMSTLKVVELDENKIRVGIVSMGSNSVGVSDVLPLKNGTSHRAVQNGLADLVKGRGDFNFATCLQRVDQLLRDSLNETVIIISVFTTPIVQSRVVDEIIHEMSGDFSELIFYHVILSTTAVFMDKSNLKNEDKTVRPNVLLIPEYNHQTARSSSVAEELSQRYGCNFCLPNPCGFGPTCVLTDGSYHCACLPGHVSGICAPCQSNPCFGSRCLVSGSSYLCDPCDPSPCQNEGECFYRDGGSICSCKENYVGQYCELQCPDCQNGGKCRYLNGTAVCECLDGFIGANCGRNCQVMIACLNGGTCGFDENQTPICFCIEPFHGRRCENLCDEYTCRNGGSCGVTNSERMCFCTPQYEGSICEVDKCDKYFQCKNDGVCGLNNETNRIECDCLPPFSGVDCSIGPCFNYTCFNGGSCKLDGDFNPSCSCLPPYSGDRCLIDPCSSSPCLNGGLCILEDQDMTFICSCRPGYWGKTCMNNPCRPNPCENGGTCVPVPFLTNQPIEYIFECLCRDSYTGYFCSSKLEITTTTTTTEPTTVPVVPDTTISTVCDPNPCVYPCKCVPSCKHSDGFVCISLDGRLGKSCSVDPPLLKCGADAVEITVDDQFLVEMLGTQTTSGYFNLGWNETDGMSMDCRSTEVLRDDGVITHKMVVPAPFTSCGTGTAINGQMIIVSNKVWFNVYSDVFDMLTPVLAWYCNYTTQYSVTTSLIPMIDNPKGTLVSMNTKFFSVKFQLCKSTSKCQAVCPSHLIVYPGAVYTVGQLINVIIQPVSVAGETLHLVDFYLSCGQNPNSTSVVTIVENGCSTGTGTGALHSSLSSNEGSTCIIFQLPRIRGCNVVYLHAKMSICDTMEVCDDSAVRGCTSRRGKRSIHEEDLFGPLYLFSFEDDLERKSVGTVSPNPAAALGKVMVKDVDLDHVFVATIIGLSTAFVMICFLVFMCFYQKRQKFVKS